MVPGGATPSTMTLNERIMTTKQINPARVGRERECVQCGTIYRSLRSSSFYCSPACRKKANRGTAPTAAARSGPAYWGAIPKALYRLGLIGQVGPFRKQDTSPPVFMLLVECAAAYEELACIFNRKGWGILSRQEFDSAIRADGIRPFSTRSPEAVQHKNWQDRQRQRINRSA